MAHQSGNTPGLQGRETGLSGERLQKLSHDFRNPLNIIIGFTELLLEEAPGAINDKQRVCLNDILKSSRRLLDLVDDIFDSSDRVGGNKFIRNVEKGTRNR